MIKKRIEKQTVAEQSYKNTMWKLECLKQTLLEKQNDFFDGMKELYSLRSFDRYFNENSFPERD